MIDDETGNPKQYESVDARCAACTVNGGPDGACVDVDYWLKTKGRLCPRVDLDPALGLEAEVLTFGCHRDTRAFAGTFFESIATSAGLSHGERVAALQRIHAVLSDTEILARLHPPDSIEPPGGSE